MKKNILSRVLLAVLAILMLWAFTACADVDKTGDWETASYVRDTEFGKGAKTVTVKVVADGQELTFTLHTDKENLEDALLEHNLIDGDEGQFGLYIKKVNGICSSCISRSRAIRRLRICPFPRSLTAVATPTI